MSVIISTVDSRQLRLKKGIWCLEGNELVTLLLEHRKNELETEECLTHGLDPT